VQKLGLDISMDKLAAAAFDFASADKISARSAGLQARTATAS
jgi:hypothetical protein